MATLIKRTTLCVVLLLLSAVARTQETQGPTEQVRESIDGVIAAVSDASLDAEAKRAKIWSHIESRFDFNGMSRRALAKYWKQATAPEQTRFVELFSKMLGNIYIGQIEAYSGEEVKYVKERIKKDKYAQIDTAIVTNTTEIPVQYRMHLKDSGEWLVYDVVVEGVSLVRNYRNSLQATARKAGFDGLLAELEAKAREPVAN